MKARGERQAGDRHDRAGERRDGVADRALTLAVQRQRQHQHPQIAGVAGELAKAILGTDRPAGGDRRPGQKPAEQRQRRPARPRRSGARRRSRGRADQRDPPDDLGDLAAQDQVIATAFDPLVEDQAANQQPGGGEAGVKAAQGPADNPYLRKSGQVVLNFVVGVNKRCRYDSRDRTIAKGDLTADRAFRGRGDRFVRVLVDVRFLGNAYLTPASSRTNVVFAKLTPHS